MSDAPLTKRQQRAAATGEQLLAAARDTFESFGYGATTVGAITRAAGTAHGTFYLHFKNKEDAFGRAVASVLDDMYTQAGPAGEKTPRDAIRAVTRAYLEVFRAHRGLWRCLLEGILQSPTIETMWLEMRHPFVERVARAVGRAQEAGMARRVDPYEAAAAVSAMCEWYAFTTFVVRDPGRSEPELDRVVDTLTDLWYHGVFTDDAATGG